MTNAANAMTPNRVRTAWADLPTDVHDAITRETGAVHKVEAIASGLNSAIAARLHTATGQVFLKGTRVDRAPAARREAWINPLVTAVSPRLRWHFETSEWHLLGFDHLPGRRAYFTPGSLDPGLLAATLTTLAAITAPPTCRSIADRWAEPAHRAGADATLFAGNRLLHTDLNPHNVLITDTAHLVDWSWPSRGAAWIDTACTALWLIAEGHNPDRAETWARTIPAWNEATPTALDAFTATQTSLWEDIAKTDPHPWKQRLHAAVRLWHAHRHGL